MRIVNRLVLALWATVVAAQEPSLADLVRRWGPIEAHILPAVPPGDPAQLFKEADVVARVRIVSVKSFENRPPSTSPSKITTDCAVDLLDIFVQRLPLPRQAGDHVIVRREGGSVSVEDIVVTERDPNFPAFDIGEEYVLVLRADPETNTFMVMYNGQGAFRIGPDWIARQVYHIEGETPEERPRQDLPMDELRSLIATLAAQP
jgi:hypothetical protein